MSTSTKKRGTETPTGFVALCRCGVHVGALDAVRTERAEMGRILSKWLMAGRTVEPRFGGRWSVNLESCRCGAPAPASHQEEE